MNILVCAQAGASAAVQGSSATTADWVEAVGTSIAAIIAAITLWKLYQRDEQKAEMIAELKTQAAESIEQSKHLGAQVEQLSQQVFQLERIHEAIASGIQIMAKSDELNERIRKQNIRPEFAYEYFTLEPGHQRARLGLLNRGGAARNFALRILKGTDVQPAFPEVILSNEKLIVRLRSSVKIESHPHYEVQFDDDEGTRYYQRFYIDATRFSSTAPQLLQL